MMMQFFVDLFHSKGDLVMILGSGMLMTMMMVVVVTMMMVVVVTMMMVVVVTMMKHRLKFLLKSDLHSCGFSPPKVLLEIPRGGDSGTFVIIQ